MSCCIFSSSNVCENQQYDRDIVFALLATPPSRDGQSTCMRMVETSHASYSNRLQSSSRSIYASSRGAQPIRAFTVHPRAYAGGQAGTGQALQQLAWPRRGTRLLLTLERSFGPAGGADAELWRRGMFAAEVWPDIPLATTWSGLFRAGLARFSQPDGGGGSAAGETISNSSQSSRLECEPVQQGEQPWTIHTVAAQVRSAAQLEQRMRMLAAHGELGRSPADGLLCVSGSHPVRRLPMADSVLSDSFAVLRLAAKLKGAGELPAGLALLAAENPLLDTPVRLEQKIEAGAEAILTQPPLVWPRFEAWMTEAHRRGLTQHAQVLVGMPLLASPANLAFWIGLCSAWRVPGIAAEVEQFRSHAANGAAAMAAFALKYNSDLLAKVLAMPGVAGLHVMPLGKGARQLAVQLFGEEDQSRIHLP